MPALVPVGVPTETSFSPGLLVPVGTRTGTNGAARGPAGGSRGGGALVPVRITNRYYWPVRYLTFSRNFRKLFKFIRSIMLIL